jgi:uncharacterized protein (TIGR00290 family)
MPKPKLLLSWSSGKDCAWTLHLLRQKNEYEIAGLLTTFSEADTCVAMHRVRPELVDAQAAAARLPLTRVQIPWPCSNAEYERRMADLCTKVKAQGVTQIAFGDLFLEEIREYRVKKLAGTGLTPVFPLWGIPQDTPRLAREMIGAGLRATLTVVDLKKLPSSFAGSEFNADLLAELPAGVDPCGENGEFHTFCHTGPMFSKPIRIECGKASERDGFYYTDLLPLT